MNQTTLPFWQRLKSHPTGFWFVFWGELAERSSFYGMRAILGLYLITTLEYPREQGASIMQFFIASCYLTPLLGGVIADRWLGRYRTILYFSVPYIVGHLVLGGIQTRTGLFIALALLALGSGSIKPNTSTLMGQIYEAEKKTFLLTEAFSYFYAAINIGSAVSSLGLPLVRVKYGYGVALSIPAALMAVAFVFFAVGKRYYPKDEVKRAVPKSAAQKKAEWETLSRIGLVFALIALFWLVYDQSASTWTYFAKDHCNLQLFPGLSLTPDQVQGLNPVLIVLFTPIFNWLWARIRRARGGIELPDTRKMLVGFLIVFAAMASMSVAGFLSASGPVSVWWLVLSTIVITVAELCISVVGLEFAYRQALPGTKSVVTAAFLLTVMVGNLLGGFVVRLYGTTLAPGPFFAAQCALIGVGGLAFIGVARRFERR